MRPAYRHADIELLAPTRQSTWSSDLAPLNSHGLRLLERTGCVLRLFARGARRGGKHFGCHLRSTSDGHNTISASRARFLFASTFQAAICDWVDFLSRMDFERIYSSTDMEGNTPTIELPSEGSLQILLRQSLPLNCSG